MSGLSTNRSEERHGSQGLAVRLPIAVLLFVAMSMAAARCCVAQETLTFAGTIPLAFLDHRVPLSVLNHSAAETVLFTRNDSLSITRISAKAELSQVPISCDEPLKINVVALAPEGEKTSACIFACASDSGAAICRIDSDRVEVLTRIPALSVGVTWLTWGDVDNDGKNEILTGGCLGGYESPPTAEIAVWSWNGRQVTKLAGLKLDTFFSSFAVGDFDADGNSEIAVAERHSEVNLYEYLEGNLEKDPEAGIVDERWDAPLVFPHSRGSGRGTCLLILDTPDNRKILRSEVKYGKFVTPEMLVDLPAKARPIGLQVLDATRGDAGEELLVHVWNEQDEPGPRKYEYLVYRWTE